MYFLSIKYKFQQCRARLSQKFGVENIVGGKIAGLGVDSSINDELRRLSLAPNDVDLDEPTGEGLKLAMFLTLSFLGLPSVYVDIPIFYSKR